MQKTFIYYTDNIEKSNWYRYVIEGVYHDMSFLFDEDKAFLIYNNGDIRIIELKTDLSGIKEKGINQLLFSTPSENIGLRCEGCRAYKLNGYYYLIFIEWPKDGHCRRRVVCYRSKELLGEYERKLLLDDDMGFQNRGIAQGVLIDTPDGNWYSILFQDHGAVGRIPYLIPVAWEEAWPVIGMEGKVPETFEIPLKCFDAKPLIISDSFDHQENILALNWQWNHNPEDDAWSFTAHPGYLRLSTCSLAGDIFSARNILTQRTEGPKCEFTVELDTAGMKAGDFAGLIAFQSNYGAVGVKIDENGQRRIVASKGKLEGSHSEDESKSINCNSVTLKITFDFVDCVDIAKFYYSLDGEEWISLGNELNMLYTLDLFIGYRIGIFYYAQKHTGGFTDWRDFKYNNK